MFPFDDVIVDCWDITVAFRVGWLGGMVATHLFSQIYDYDPIILVRQGQGRRHQQFIAIMLDIFSGSFTFATRSLSLFIQCIVSTFPIVFILFLGCVYEVVVPSYTVNYYIYIYIYMYIPWHLGFSFPSLLWSLWCVQIFEYIKTWSSYFCLYITLFHYHHYADLPKGIVHTKCLSYIFCRVCY